MQAELASFLATILPNEGLRCVAVLGGQRPIQKFFRTNEEAARFALSQDAKGFNVYHACSTFKTNESRKTENVNSIKSLWLDVDCGPGKPYDDIRGALAALRSFLQLTSLPKPVIAGSGRGLHLYWPISNGLLPGDWLGYARGLKAQCGLWGFAADPVRTTDAASILRPVGTHNRKNLDAPILVTWGGPEGPYEIEAFGKLRVDVASGGLGRRPSYLPALQMAVFETACAGEHETTPSDANEIADRCAQISVCRNLRGALPEPLWRAALGVVAWCENGPEVAHEWSKGDARYDPVETQGKIARLLKLTGPTTCKTFQGLNAKACEGCRFALEISTPLELGRPPWSMGGATNEKTPLENYTNLGKPTPEGFVLDETGLYFSSEDLKTGKHITKYVSRTQFKLSRISETDNERGRVQYTFLVTHKNDGTHEATIPASAAHGSQAYSTMAAFGIPLENGDLFRTYLNAAAAQLRAERKATVSYKQFGFKDNDQNFVIGNRMYTKHGVVPAEVTGTAADRARHFTLKGTLDE